MAALKKYNLEGKETGKVQVDKALAEAKANSQMIKDYIVVLRNNARQWSANTKDRSEVAHTTQKPHRQKGTGNARQGSLVSPQYRGGGIVFGPKPKFDQAVTLNKREKRAAIRALIGQKIRENQVHIIEDSKLDEPKTKTVAQFLKTCALANKRILFLGEGSYTAVETNENLKKVSVHSDKHENFIKSLNNIPRVEFSLALNVSGYDVICAHDIVMTEAALKEIIEWLC